MKCYQSISPPPRRGGAVAPLVAISIVAILAVTGLVIDGGFVLTERRRAQSVADASALAAAQDLLNNKSLPQAVKSAYEYADLNGYHTDSSGWKVVPSGSPPSVASTLAQGEVTISVNIPPKSGPHAGNREFVEVIASRRLDPFFIQVVGSGASNPGARAVAGVVRRSPPPFGLVALNKNGNGIQINGTGGFAVGAPVLVLSTDPNSMTLGGAPTATSTGPSAGWYTDGGYNSIPIYSWTDGTRIPAGSVSGFRPTPRAIPSTMAKSDPLITLAVPPADGLATYPAVNLTGGSRTINPGIYNGGIKATGSSTLTLNPGLYIINGGGVQIGTYATKPLLPGQVDGVDNIYPLATDSSSIIANNVTIYNTGTSSTFGPLLVSYYGSNSVITPPAALTPGAVLDWSKGYPGLSFFQDRNNTKLVWIVNQKVPMQGTYYAASGVVRFNGQGINPAKPVQLVAGRIIIDTDTPDGNAESDVPYDARVFAPPPEIYLVE